MPLLSEHDEQNLSERYSSLFRQIVRSEFVGKGEAIFDRKNAVRGSGAEEAGGGGGNSIAEGRLDRKVSVQAEEDAGGEGIPCADGADDAPLRHTEAALNVENSIMSERAGAFGEVDDDPLADTGGKELPGGGFDRRERNEAAGLGGDASRSFDFELVHDAIIGVAEGWENDVREALAVLAHDINAGFESGIPRRVQHTGGGCAEVRIALIE